MFYHFKKIQNVRDPELNLKRWALFNIRNVAKKDEN